MQSLLAGCFCWIIQRWPRPNRKRYYRLLNEIDQSCSGVTLRLRVMPVCNSIGAGRIYFFSPSYSNFCCCATWCGRLRLAGGVWACFCARGPRRLSSHSCNRSNGLERWGATGPVARNPCVCMGETKLWILLWRHMDLQWVWEWEQR